MAKLKLLRQFFLTGSLLTLSCASSGGDASGDGSVSGTGGSSTSAGMNAGGAESSVAGTTGLGGGVGLGGPQAPLRAAARGQAARPGWQRVGRL